MKGGKGNDEITITQVNSTNVVVTHADEQTGALAGATVSIDIGRTELTVEGGEGNDTLQTNGAMDMSVGRMLVKAIADFVSEKVEEAEAFKGQNILSGGAGDDVITVATTTGFANHFGIANQVDGGAGFDRLHLEGKLDDEAESPITGGRSKLVLKTLAEIRLQSVIGEVDVPISKLRDTLTLGIANTEAYTDTLANKTEVQLSSPVNSVNPFTNYRVNPTSGQALNFALSAGAGEGFLSNLWIQSDGKVLLGNVDAGNLNLVVQAPEIEIAGAVSARNILALAQAADHQEVNGELFTVEDDLAPEDNPDGDLSSLSVELSIYNAMAHAKLTVQENAVLKAREAVELLAAYVQEKPYLPGALAELNMVTVKLGSAVMDILGQVTAGGAIRAKASASGAVPSSSPTAGIPSAPATQEDIEKALDGRLPQKDGNTGTGKDPNTKGEADQFADNNIKSAANMADKVNSKNVSGAQVTALSQNRQTAQTSEGSVQVAAAMALNIQKNIAKATIGDGLTLNASGDVRVRSLNDTDAVIMANAGATNSNIGVGVGGAVNIVTYKNIALLGNSRVNAGGQLLVEAAQKRTAEQIIADLIRYLGEMGYLDRMFSDQSMIKELGLNLENEILELLGKDSGYMAMSSQEQAEVRRKLRAQVVEALVAKLQAGETKDVANEAFRGIIESVTAKFLNKLISVEMLESLLLGTESPLKTFLDEAGIVGKTTALKIKAAVLAYLAAKFGSDDEMGCVGHRISTQAVSGVGAANVGVAGAAAVTVLNGTTQALVKDAQGGAPTQITAGKGMILHGESSQKVYTTASASSDLMLNNAMKNKSKSGQGGTSVGVGASSAINIVNTKVEAMLGKYRQVNAGFLDVYALVQNDVDAVSVAGSDPIARRDEAQEATPTLGAAPQQVTDASNTTTKDISVDASAALSLVENTVTALVNEGTVLSISGLPISQEVKDSLRVYALQAGESYTSSSAFAAGGKAAVGACIAANIALSDVQARVEGSGQVRGGGLMEAATRNADICEALATVVGASLNRYLEKLRYVLNFVSFGTSDVSNLSGTVTNKLNSVGNPIAAGAGSAVSKLPFSANILKVFNVNLPAAPDNGKAQAEVDKHVGPQKNSDGTAGSQSPGGQALDGSAKQKQSVNIAAAVGVSYTDHQAKAILSGALEFAGGVRVLAQNHANFRTLGTGATVTTDMNANNISAGIAVTVNHNGAAAQVLNNLSTGGDVTVQAKLTQNLDDAFAGLLSAQALAGSVSTGKGGKVSIAGAVAAMVARAKALAEIGAGAVVKAPGHTITVQATDKSNETLLEILASLSGAGGSGASVAGTLSVLVSGSQTLAQTGNRVTLTANNGSILILADGKAQQIVALLAATGGTANAAVGATVNVGVFRQVVKALVGEDSILTALNGDAEVRASGDGWTLLITAAGGTTTGTAGIAGAIPVVVQNNIIISEIGQRTQVRAGGSVGVAAQMTNKVYSAGLAVGGGSTAGVGATLNTLVMNSTVLAGVKNYATLIGHGVDSLTTGIQMPNRQERRKGVVIAANAQSEIVLGSVSGGAAGTAGIAGTVNTLVATNTVQDTAGQNVCINTSREHTTQAAQPQNGENGAGQEVVVEADDDSHLYDFGGSLAAGGTAGVGATIVTLVYNKNVLAKIDAGSVTFARKSVRVAASGKDEIYLLALSFSGAGTAAVSVAGNVLVFKNQVEAALDGTVNTFGTVQVTAGAQATIRTFAGYLSQAADSGGAGRIDAPNALLTIENQTISFAMSTILSLAAGGTAINGNVLLVFNRTDAVAALSQVQTQAKDIVVRGVLNATADALLASATAGSFAVGASVAYVHLNAKNWALLDVSGATVQAGTAKIYAGTKEEISRAKASATTVAGAVGALAVGINAAIADNQAINHAQVLGDAAGSLTLTGKLDIQAHGEATALAEVAGLAIGGAAIVGSFVTAILRSHQEAVLAGGQITAASLTAESHLNATDTDAQKDTAIARLLNGQGGIVSVTMNLAVAYGRSQSLAGGWTNALTLTGSDSATGLGVKVGSYGNAGTLAQVYNLFTVGKITVGVMGGLAFGQAVFNAALEMTGSSAAGVTIETDYLARAMAKVEPSLAGVQAGGTNVNANISVAQLKSKSQAKLSGSAALTFTGSMTVSATGKAFAEASIGVFQISLTRFNVAANVLVADQSASQTASIEGLTLQGASNGGGAVKVISRLNEGSAQGAAATMGGNGGIASASMLETKANIGLAYANGVSSALIKDAQIITAGSIGVESTGTSYAQAKVAGNLLNAGAGSLGVNVLYAQARGEFTAQITSEAAKTLKGASVTAEVRYTARSEAVSAQPSGGASLKGLNINTNVADANTSTQALAGITGQTVIEADSGPVKALSAGTATADAAIEGITFSLSAITVAVNIVKARVTAEQPALPIPSGLIS